MGRSVDYANFALDEAAPNNKMQTMTTTTALPSALRSSLRNGGVNQGGNELNLLPHEFHLHGTPRIGGADETIHFTHVLRILSVLSQQQCRKSCKLNLATA